MRGRIFVGGLAVVALLLTGCEPVSQAPTPARVAKFTVSVYVYETDTDASEFIDTPVTIIMEATTVATDEPVLLFDLGDGTMSATFEKDVEHTPFTYEFYEADVPTNVSVSAATVVPDGQTLACHVFAGPEVDAAFITFDEAPGFGPAGVTCDFVIF